MNIIVCFATTILLHLQTLTYKILISNNVCVIHTNLLVLAQSSSGQRQRNFAVSNCYQIFLFSEQRFQQSLLGNSVNFLTTISNWLLNFDKVLLYIYMYIYIYYNNTKGNYDHETHNLIFVETSSHSIIKNGIKWEKIITRKIGERCEWTRFKISDRSVTYIHLLSTNSNYFKPISSIFVILKTNYNYFAIHI